jgi:hypothetical protein
MGDGDGGFRNPDGNCNQSFWAGAGGWGFGTPMEIAINHSGSGLGAGEKVKNDSVIITMLCRVADTLEIARENRSYLG